MKRIVVVAGLGILLALAPAARRATAQAEEAGPVPGAGDSAETPVKKKGGLLGKAKGLVGNKVVKAVAKTAACTMVPGGQVIAGAIDAASSETAGEAVAGAAGATGGGSCMPGMDVAGVGGAAPGPATGIGAMPTGGMPTGATPTGATPGTGAAEEGELARCLGLTAEEYLDLTDPTRGEARPMTRDESKRQASLSGKLDMARFQQCAMRQSSGVDH